MSALRDKLKLLTRPGDTILETLEEIGMSQTELAERLGRTPKYIIDLIKGKAHINTEIAAGLENILGASAGFWLELERAYQNELMEIQILEFEKECINWVSKFPVADLKKLGYLPKTKKKGELVNPLLSFFRVAKPIQYEEIYYNESVSYKIELKFAKDPEAISVWLRLGELDAEKIELKTFDKKRLRASIGKIKDISYRMPSSWMDDLRSTLAKAGVAISYTPCIRKAPIYGAARWIRNKTIPLIQVTDRGKDANKFWFTLYHELGHILLHGKKDIYIDGNAPELTDAVKENEANTFATNHLLSNDKRRVLDDILAFQITPPFIKSLSVDWQVHPSILVSQLQRIEKIEYSNRAMNALKYKIEFNKE